jgi:hypothetical protein
MPTLPVEVTVTKSPVPNAPDADSLNLSLSELSIPSEYSLPPLTRKSMYGSPAEVPPTLIMYRELSLPVFPVFSILD